MWIFIVTAFILPRGFLASLSCPDYKAMNAKVNFEDIKTMEEEAIVECLPYMGREPLEEAAGKHIWDTLVKVNEGVEGISDLEIRQLGWVLTHVPEDDLNNFTLSEIDTISSLGRFRNLSEEQLQVLANRALQDWANKKPSDYTHYDLAALYHILCGFNRTSIEEIHADSYKDAASNVANLQSCPGEALSALADLAQANKAYGLASTWSTSQLKNVGCVINGLTSQSLALIPPPGFESLTPDLIPCLSPETLKSLDSSQLSHLTPSAIAALTAQQQSVLSKQQHKSVAAAYEGIETEKSGALIKSEQLILVVLGCYFTL